MSNSSIKSKTVRVFSAFRSFCVEFCDNSTIHGVRYLSEQQLHWSERLLWLLAIIVSLCLCGSVTRNIWSDWSENPVTINIIEKTVNISSIPFPTVTICPEIKSIKRKFDVDNALKSPHTEKHRLNALTHFCPRLQKSLDVDENVTDDSIYETIQTMAVEIKDIISGCDFMGLNDFFYDCKLLVPVFTSIGLCFTFNALNSHDTYTDQMAKKMEILKNSPNVTKFNLDTDLVKSNYDNNSYPHHMAGVGRFCNLKTWLNFVEPFDEFHCEYFDGFQVMLTVPGETLATTRNIYRFSRFDNALISLKPKLYITSADLQAYNPIQRQCYFDSERNLHFFRIYTQFNCEEECLANFTQIDCGCVPFFMPRTNDNEICGVAKIHCYQSAAKKFRTTSNSVRDQCNCLPSCTYIEYNVDIERIEVEDSKHYTKINFRLVELLVFFASNRLEVVERIPSYTYSAFFADLGSLLGLFMGISVLSIVELIYYSTLRQLLTFQPHKLTMIDKKITMIIEWRLFQRIPECLKDIFVDFSNNSNIHGILYYTRRGLHWIERIWWVIAFGLSVWLCSALIRNVWLQWQDNPVSVSQTDTMISSIPFPTVTICPEIKFSRKKFQAYRFSSAYDEEVLTNIVVHTFHNYVYHYGVVLQLKKFAPNASELIYKTIEKTALDLDGVIKDCRWRGQVVNCSDYLKPILTEDGLCFSFNAINSDELYTEQMTPSMKIIKTNPNTSGWSLETGYKNRIIGQKYPFPLTEPLELTLVRYKYDFTVEYLSGKLYNGFKVSINTPGDTLRLLYDFLQVQISQVAQITLSPKLTTTVDPLRRYDPKQRGCFFQSERKLRFFRTYSQFNCETECLANLTRTECGCVKFSMPRDINTTICGISKLDCYRKILSRPLWDKVKVDSMHWTPIDCDCLPACTSIEYNSMIDRMKFHKVKALPRNAEYAKLSIFFENQQIEVINQMEKYTIADFLAICGGLLGLGMGASAISFIEIIYFFTLRVFCRIRRQRIDNQIVFIQN